ncbi:uncharacterized protein BX664DRAFT_325103 [Halteromyces radiatus]|uniref:uncharacterized protein n=1 Tax=Halteromyces radiatus TaxID=101107 RepID=UPI00221F0D66|nr:uncharacterized protein BX664DRAFT_325103 [Halteromyces radiatus]KAI8096883.1 hypothetical protein BX664DRAFT_325103 [Halteromyces radiatus]
MATPTTNNNNSNTNHASDDERKEAKIELRPYYEETDRKYVQYLFYSTYLNLVPRGVKLRVLSWPPVVSTIWLCAFAALVQLTIIVVTPLGWPWAMMVGVYSALVFVSVGGGLVLLLWYVDTYDVSERVLDGIDNDVGDIESFYRGWHIVDNNVEHNDGTFKRKDDDNGASKGQFWVLTVNDDVVGCIGVDQHTKPVMKKVDPSRRRRYVRASEQPRMTSSPQVAQAEWPRTAYVLAVIDDIVRQVLVGATDLVRDRFHTPNNKESPQEILFPVHQENEASVRRLAIKTEFQGHGLSTPLLKRVGFWAHSQNIDYLYAETDELQYEMEQVLEKRHGYKLVSRTKLGWYKTRSVWKLDVKYWMQTIMEQRAKEKELEDQQKEDQELKEYQ